MLKRYFISRLITVIVIVFLIGIISCDTVTEPSPDPGILKITLQSDLSDTSIIIVTDTFYVSQNDSLDVKIFQGKVYKDTVYSVLYKDIKSYKQEEINYNIIKRDSLGYKRYVIFKSFVPPLDYDRIKFGITSNILKIGDFDIINVQSPENANLFINLYKNFHVSENDTTEINIQIRPFKSITRYRDSYQFIPDVIITDVIYH